MRAEESLALIHKPRLLSNKPFSPSCRSPAPPAIDVLRGIVRRRNPICLHPGAQVWGSIFGASKRIANNAANNRSFASGNVWSSEWFSCYPATRHISKNTRFHRLSIKAILRRICNTELLSLQPPMDGLKTFPMLCQDRIIDEIPFQQSRKMLPHQRILPSSPKECKTRGKLNIPVSVSQAVKKQIGRKIFGGPQTIFQWDGLIE